jgi:hypothetical protein
MKPLVLRDIAEELDLHESTVSRATGNKYMATPHGTFEFKHFFPRKLEAAGRAMCSASAAKVLIRDMIAAERHTDPLSDVALAQNLAGGHSSCAPYRDQVSPGDEDSAGRDAPARRRVTIPFELRAPASRATARVTERRQAMPAKSQAQRRAAKPPCRPSA